MFFKRTVNALAKKNANFSTLMIGATHIKTHRIAASAVKKVNGRTKGGLNSKIHLVSDGAGKSVSVMLFGRNEADIPHAKQCLEPVITK